LKKFFVAALTGRSGSGKSYASEYMSGRGVPIIDGDVVARGVVGKNSRCLRELVRAFGADILKEDGELNRKKLADICFPDRRKKRRLDSITHPYIIEKLLDGFDEYKSRGHDYCVVEAGALVESGLYAVCDKIVMVTASEESQIERIIKRDGITEQQARTRLQAQLGADEIRGLCDMVITNDGTIEEFEAKLDVLIGQLEGWFKQ
jgi:dephospho-CoA kinase